MKIKYFAWIKDITNLEEEEIDLNEAKNLDELKTFIETIKDEIYS